MFIAAHLFAGALIGSGFWHLAKDRRAVPLCMAGAILPDLVDKPLGLLLPSVLPGGRTAFHALVIVGIILLCTFFLFRSRSRWLCAGLAGAVLLHQVLDEMWLLPVNWYYPLLGPFQGHMIPDYIGTYLWLELGNPSEWLFLIGSVVILAGSHRALAKTPFHGRSDRLKNGVLASSAVAFSGAGIYLVFTGLTGVSNTFIAPEYDPVPAVFAGVLALCGTVVLGRELGGHPRRTVE